MIKLAKVKFNSKLKDVVFFVAYGPNGMYFENVDDQKILHRTDGQDLYTSRSYPIDGVSFYTTKLGYSFVPNVALNLGLTGANPPSINLNGGNKSTENWYLELYGWNSTLNTANDVFTLTNRSSDYIQSNDDAMDGSTISYTIDKVSVPSDIQTNLVTGDTTVFNRLIVNFAGNIAKGDKLTVKYGNETITTNIIENATNVSATWTASHIPDGTHWSFEYTHGEAPQPPKPAEKTYKLVSTLQNAKIIEPQPIEDDYGKLSYYLDPKHTTIKLQANDGYSFDSDGSLKYNRSRFNKATLTIKATHTNTATITLPTDIDWSSQQYFMLTMSAVKSENVETPKPPKPVEKTTVEFTSSDDGIQWQNATMIDSGSNFTNPVIIQKGYELRQPLAVEFTDKNDKTVTLTYGSGSNVYFDGDTPNKTTWNLTVNTGYKKLNIKAGQTKYKTYELQTTLQNAKIIEPQAIEDDYGKTRYYLDPKHTTIKLQANDGYTFESDGSLTYQRDLLDRGTLTIKATHTNTATVTLPSNIDWSNQDYFMLTMGAVKSEIVETTGGFTNIYKADYTNLLKFSNEVIVKITGGQGGSIQSYDVTPYINNLIMLPFNVPTGEKSTIVAGNETFTTQLPTVDNNYLTVDLGKIKVDEQYKNGFDYYQVKTRLMLPYTNMIELDPKHVINQTVSIKYIVNVVNGDTTINLSNNDDLFYSNQVNLASEIPFISSATKGSQYTVINQLKTVFRNSIKQAYIIIEQPTPVLNSDFYPTNEKGTLKGYTGNVKASLLNNMDINSNELNALQNILETGVKIK